MRSSSPGGCCINFFPADVMNFHDKQKILNDQQVADTVGLT